jgi:hypothetical protein
MENMTPPAVDLSKLKSILGNAKKVMNKVAENDTQKEPKNKIRENSYNDEYDYSYNAPSTPMYSESDERDMNFTTPDLSRFQNKPKMYSKEQVMASKLPEAIKEAMIKTPIPQLAMPPSKFDLNDLRDLVDEPKQQPKRVIKESNGNGMITISHAELNDLIDKRVNKILAEMFTKTISEQSIKKTISTLISEGKLTTKKKI